MAVPTGRGRRALLIDTDNVTILNGRTLSNAETHFVFKRTFYLAGEVDFVKAIAPRRTNVRVGAELAALGIRWEQVEQGPDAADRRIVERAMQLIASGYTEICIASCDHYFARLGSSVALTVINPLAGKPIARELRATATAIFETQVTAA